MVESSEKVAIPVLSIKLHKMAEAHPYDQTIVAMASILGKMADNNKVFISRNELKDLYNKLYSRNTKFAEYFHEELGDINNLSGPTFAEKSTAPITSTHEYIADPILSNALNAAFDNAPLKQFSNQIAAKAKQIVATNLDVWNLRASKLEVAAGNEHFIIVKADYDTPKGVTSILVPVEVNKEKVLEPGVFIANAGPQDLNNTNIKKYVTSYSGKGLKVSAKEVLAVATVSVTGKKDITDVELAVIRMNSNREKTAAVGGITGLKLDAEPKNIEVFIPKSAEADSFAAKFASESGVAGFKFGNDKISLGREVITRTIAGLGIKNPQISVVACDDNTIFYGVSLFGGKAAFKVPVKVANNRVINPDFIICNGSVASFSKESISELLVNGSTDAKVVAATSPQHNLGPAELVQNVKAAVSEGNYAKAEDALNVLQQSGNVSAYKDAFCSYINGMGMTKQASEKQTACSLIVKAKTSSHQMCGHTNLPLHKVYQDDQGNCQPLYRKGMDETYQGAFFMNAKIFG